MKAKELFEQYKSANFSQHELVTIVDSLIQELKAMMMTRKIKSDDSFKSLIREIDYKYKAFCRLVDKEFEGKGYCKAPPELFVNAMHGIFPILKGLYP